MSEEKNTKTDRLIKRLKNNRWLAYLILAAIVIIGLGQFTGALKSIGEFISLSPNSNNQTKTIKVIVKDLENLKKEILENNTYKSSLKLSVSAFSSQNEQYSSEFSRLWRLTDLAEDELFEVERLYELEQYLFVNHGIPFLNKNEREQLWFVTDGLRANEQMTVKEYSPRKINPGDMTKLDEFSFGLFNKALIKNSNSKFGSYVKTILVEWEQNEKIHKELIDFMEELEWDVAYMKVEHFLNQNSEYSQRFNKIVTRANENVNLKNLGFSEPYDTEDYIDELIIVLKRWLNSKKS